MKSKLSIVLLGVLVFALGGVAGAVSYYLYREHIRPRPAGVGMPLKPNDIVDNIAEELELDAAQKQSLKVIFRETRQQFKKLNEDFGPRYEVLNRQYGPKYEELHRQYRPRFEAIRNDSEQRIKKMLNPEQRKKYEEFLRKVRSMSPMQPPPSR